MEEFVNSVENQSFPLHPVDTQSAFLNIPNQFFFPNRTGSKDFMPSDVLKAGFYKALSHFPILVGHLQPDKAGTTHVVVDRNNLNMPEYLESRSTAVSFETMRKRNFHWSAWPDGVATVGGIATANSAGVIKLLNVHVVRLDDGIILFINIPHYVVDGVGYFAFAALWGEMCRTGGTAARQYCFDRSVIAQNLPEERTPLNKETISIFKGFNPVADWLAWLSPETRGWVLSKAQFTAGVSSSTFRVARAKLDELRAQVNKYMAADEALDDACVLATLVAMMAAHAHRDCAMEQPQRGIVAGAFGWVTGLVKSLVGSEPTHRPVVMLSDLRKGLHLERYNYTGNVLLPFNEPCPIAVLEAPISPETLAQTARIVTRTYTATDPPLIGSFVDMVAQNPYCFTRPMMFLQSNPKAVVVTNELDFDIYSVDFGYGQPEWACAVPSFVANFVAIMPSPPPGIDIVVNIIMKTTVLDKIVANKYWQNIATLIY
ncbi:hypothetical protein GGI23_000009 [Coemansia sp. RSA 2559]|nr:hypothetical protein GGI23_000009 [Coemansia sp. RSA 2559]KAJ2869765.1 hypothetical protein GGI22_000007 [Coemansia erecta]